MRAPRKALRYGKVSCASLLVDGLARVTLGNGAGVLTAVLRPGNAEYLHRAHWITSSARSSRSDGMRTPIVFAALRLMTSSNCLGCSTGRLAGLAPLRILST